MKKIQIKTITLINFKGLRHKTIEFSNNTNIYGDNAKGKTTIFDAFTWLMFGKDSTDRKDFEIKTLDSHNIVIPQIEHEVSAFLIVDNEPLTLRRVLKENWVKKRGGEEREFTGNVTDYYWNDVPMQQKEFQSKVSVILDELVFKLITNPLAFNSMKWQDRRNALTQIVGEVSDTELASGNSEYEKLIAHLVNGKTLEDYRKQIAASVKKAKDDIKLIPTRIDEVFRSKPEALNFEVLENELSAKNKSLEKVDAEIADINTAYNSKLDSHRSDKLKANNIKSEIEIIEQNAKKEAQARLKPDTSALDALVKEKTAKEQELQSFEGALKTLQTKKQGIEENILSIIDKMDAKRLEWQEENAKTLTFNDDDFHCPTCKREFEAGDVESKKAQALSNFKTNKQNRLNQINTDGGNLKNEKESLEAELKTIDSRIDSGKDLIKTAKEELQAIIDKIVENKKTSTSGQDARTEEEVYKSILDNNQKYQELLIQLEAIESSIIEVPKVDNAELVEKRNLLVSEIDSIKQKLQTKSQIEAADKRILELESEEKTLAQQISNVEKEQFVIENFNKLKIDTIESKINEKFKFVKFKMFATQINGGEVECCDCLIDGVPFSDANNAAKINAGLDIINTLCEFYQVTAPIFIDNRESIVELIPCESQIVNLIVWKGSDLNVGNPKVNGEIIKINKELLEAV